MVIVDVVVAASVALIVGVVVLTAKFSRELPIHHTFDELWFENTGTTEDSTEMFNTSINTNSEVDQIEIPRFEKAA